MDDIDLKGEKVCAFLSVVIKDELSNKSGVVAYPCLKQNCEIYNSQKKGYSLRVGVENEE